MKYVRPSTPTVNVERTAVDGHCSACGAADLASYQVLSEGGWFEVVKCQTCLTSMSRVADEIGPIELLSRSL